VALEPIIIDQDELLKHISETIGKTKVLKLTDILYNRMFDVKGVIRLTFYPEKEIAFRAAWILENLVLTKPLRFIDDLDYLVAQFFKIKNKSCQRHYAKVLMHLTGPKMDKAVKAKIDSMDMEPVVERCFDLIISPKSPVAVKVFSCQVLFNLRTRYNWISEILIEQIRILMNGGKPAMQSKGRALLSYLLATDKAT
jgi:hypothetical protein